MSSGTVNIADVVVPEVFTPYVQTLTEEKSRLIQSGAVARDAGLDALLAGGGLTFKAPSWKDLDNEDENVSADSSGGTSTPKKLGTFTEIAVRLNRNQSWAASNLAAQLAGSDPMAAIANRVSAYWVKRLQKIFVATMTGVFNDNEAAPTGSEHTTNDLTYDISGGAYADGVTNFSAEAFVDTCALMGDSMEDLSMIFVHSIVYARMQKNNMIDFVVDAQQNLKIPTFLGREVVVDDGMPATGGVYESWLFGGGAVRLGMGTPKRATAVDYNEAAGNGAGVETLFSRQEFCMHPVGHKFAVASPADGGPSNASTSGNLAHADSWARVYPERKQIKIARLISRES